MGFSLSRALKGAVKAVVSVSPTYNPSFIKQAVVVAAKVNPIYVSYKNPQEAAAILAIAASAGLASGALTVSGPAGATITSAGAAGAKFLKHQAAIKLEKDNNLKLTGNQYQDAKNSSEGLVAIGAIAALAVGVL